MNNCIIGIAGKAGAGKDTVASMINYIKTVGVTKATFQEYLTHRINFDYMLKKRIIHFADSLKDVLSIIYDIPREHFDDREIKDDMYYCFKEHRFVDIRIANSFSYRIIELSDLQDEPLANHVEYGNYKAVITLRTLMQYFGTEVCRTALGRNIWIDSAMRKAADIAERNNFCIIPDVRFRNEEDAIYKSSLYGGLIVVQRQTDMSDAHSSEQLKLRAVEDDSVNKSFIISNNGSKLQLFYKVLNVIQNL